MIAIMLPAMISIVTSNDSDKVTSNDSNQIAIYNSFLAMIAIKLPAMIAIKLLLIIVASSDSVKVASNDSNKSVKVASNDSNKVTSNDSDKVASNDSDASNHLNKVAIYDRDIAQCSELIKCPSYSPSENGQKTKFVQVHTNADIFFFGLIHFQPYRTAMNRGIQSKFRRH